MFRHRLRGVPAGVSGSVVGALCVASVVFGGRMARADGEDHAFASHLVGELERAHAPVTADAIRQAKEALERATRFRAAGDELHARAADGLAREWAETGRDLGLAGAAEEQAADRRRKATDAQAKLERTRALVEEGVARVGRMRAELEAASPASSAARVVRTAPLPTAGSGSPASAPLPDPGRAPAPTSTKPGDKP